MTAKAGQTMLYIAFSHPAASADYSADYKVTYLLPRPKATTTSIGERAPLNHMSGWSRKANSSESLYNGRPARAH
jgi:hypothetical protein